LRLRLLNRNRDRKRLLTHTAKQLHRACAPNREQRRVNIAIEISQDPSNMHKLVYINCLGIHRRLNGSPLMHIGSSVSDFRSSLTEFKPSFLEQGVSSSKLWKAVIKVEKAVSCHQTYLALMKATRSSLVCDMCCPSPADSLAFHVCPEVRSPDADLEGPRDGEHVFTDSAGMTLAYARSRCVRKMLAICVDRQQPGSDHIVWRICWT
jgi:hypothetical protein